MVKPVWSKRQATAEKRRWGRLAARAEDQSDFHNRACRCGHAVDAFANGCTGRTMLRDFYRLLYLCIFISSGFEINAENRNEETF